NYRLSHYSDNNFANELFTEAQLTLFPSPKELKLVLLADYLAFDQGTIFRNGIVSPDNIAGAIHPYFAPSGFLFTEARLEFKQYLSRDTFTHADVLYYSLQYGLGVDSNAVAYNDFRVLFNYDVEPWLSVGADTQIFLSSVYTLTTAHAYVHLRWP